MARKKNQPVGVEPAVTPMKVAGDNVRYRPVTAAIDFVVLVEGQDGKIADTINVRATLPESRFHTTLAEIAKDIADGKFETPEKPQR